MLIRLYFIFYKNDIGVFTISIMQNYGDTVREICMVGTSICTYMMLLCHLNKRFQTFHIH